MLELRDSVITYRSRYLTVLQPGPVLDLVLADEGNPRGLAFQLAAARDMLVDLERERGSPLAQVAESLIEDARRMVRDVAEAPAQAEAAVRLRPPATWRWRGDIHAVGPNHPALVRAAAGLPQPGTCPGGPAARRRVIYRVRHTTRYAYGSTVDLAAHMLHLRPRDLS